MISLPVATFNTQINDANQVNSNFTYLENYFNGNIEASAFASNLTGSLSFTGPALTISSTGALAGPLVNVLALSAASPPFTLVATDAFVLSSDLMGPWVSIAGEWTATNGTITTNNFHITALNASAKYGAFTTAALPTPAGPAITYNTTENQLWAYNGSSWGPATSHWIQAPLTISGGALSVSQATYGSYIRGKGVASGASTATVSSFVKDRAASPLLLFAQIVMQKTSGSAEASGFDVTAALKRGTTTLDTITYKHGNETSGKSNGGSVTWNVVLPNEPAGTNNYSLEVSHTSSATITVSTRLGVVEL